MWAFIHIPKTAGTSFRKGIELSFGLEAVAYDYGLDSPLTSSHVRHFLEGNIKSVKDCCQHLSDEGRQFIAGHVPANRYSAAIGWQNTLVFLRHPLHRSFSEYQHKDRHGQSVGSFSFYSLQRTNPQSKHLRGMPIEGFGFFGLTERYKESLSLLEYMTGLKVKGQKINRAPLFSPTISKLSKEEVDSFHEANGLDMLLYNRACEVFDQRMSLMAKRKPIAHGTAEIIDSQLRGWAYWSPHCCRQPSSITIEVLQNGELVAELSPTDPIDYFKNLNPPSRGHIGFSIPMTFSAGDHLIAQVTETGQVLMDAVVDVPLD